MTRINCVPVQELHIKHLIAEYHELPRVFGYVRKALERGEDPAKVPGIPPTYTLGTGHIKFFYPRLGYLTERYAELVVEMVARKKMVNFPNLDGLTAGLPKHLFKGWKPTKADQALNRARLEQRLAEIMAKPKRPVPSHKD